MTFPLLLAVAAFETCRVSAFPFNREWPGHERELAQTREAKFVRVEADGREQELDVGPAALPATLLPMSAANRLTARDGRWRLRLDAPADYVVDFGEAAPAVHVFGQPPWSYAPQAGDLYFGPGEHDVGTLAISNSNCRVVIDRGAVFFGTLRVTGATNVTVCGRGTVDGSRCRRRNGGLLRFAKCRGARIEGLVLRDSGGFNLTLDDCDDTVVDGVKIIGAWRYNSDGIDVCASRDTVVRNCFVRSYDDCVVARGACPWVADAPLSRMMVSNNVLWCDWGKNCEVWAGSRPGVVEDVTYCGNRLVRTAGVAMDVTTWFGSSNTVVRNIRFEDQELDLENDRWALKLQAFDGEEFVRTRQPECVFGNVDCTGIGPEGGNEIDGDSDADCSNYRLVYSNVVYSNIRAYNVREPLVLRVVADPRYHLLEGFSAEGLPEGTVIRRQGPASNNPVFQTDRVRSLAGRWRLTLDGNDAGFIHLPSTTDIAGKGDGLVGGQPVERIHPQLLGAKMTQALTMRLTRRHPFVGVAAYEKEVVIPASWTNRHVTLTLERTKIVRAFVDGIALGRRETLTTPAVFALPAEIGHGRHVIRLEVDNRLDALPVSGHQVSDDTQTNWNGVMGRIELRAEDARAIARVDAYPDAATGRVRFRAIVRDGGTVRTNWTEKSYPPSAPRWSEFSPTLIADEIEVDGLKAKVRFGFRDFATKGTQFTVNGRVTFLRGRHDACVWPLTGAAPMDLDTWRGYFRTLREYGLNHVRCHSWCPPEAAFAAADEAGFYLQPEFPCFGGDFENDARLRDYCLAESKRILDAYGNHPSFVMYTLANEPLKGREARRRIVRELKAYDSRHLYAQGSNGDFIRPSFCAGDGFWSTFRSVAGEAGNVRGSYAHANCPLGGVQLPGGGTLRDFSAALRHSPVPLVGHEVGQYQAYPDFDEMAKYTGVLKPVNYAIFRSRLAQAGMLGLAKDFFRASGALMAINYREDIEEALRTPGFGGFQLLDLQDFPGQGTALVGILDAFMESKGFVTPEAWRGFCAPTVLLARFPSHTLFEGGRLQAQLQLAHYGREDVLEGTLVWRLADGETTVETGSCPVAARVGAVTDLAQVDIALRQTGRARKLSLELALAGTAVRNRYPIWVYPQVGDEIPAGVEVVRDLSSAERLLDEGRRVLCVLDAAQAPAGSVPGAFASDFWNWEMFCHICKSGGKPPAPGTLGLLVRNGHPALAGFPSSFHSDWQWRELILNGVNVVLDDDPEADIIVQGIDNVSRNHRLGVIWEKRRGAGRLLVSAIDFERCAGRPEAAALRRSLLDCLGQ
ncbi:MAG: glycosyl hydrolase family 28 protein [Kiritimatiellia bacterium]